ncbi:hypothetical protein [Actinophytocola oryzae]|uniref:Signal transduction histidine kinase n=1 Tax=Actinophytocola oryzae TaxID=502181 RepID=A0A4R7V378_9PSEU|nr:hypothetical protein [Actinophytocola oryzae]TDV43134.1 hypothetical protein CLV71_11668 [Actinophytocola oryzae]
MPEDDAELIVANVLRGLRWATVAVTLAVVFGLQVPVVLANREAYTSYAVQWLVIAVYAGVALVVAAETAWHGDLGRWRWPLVALVLAASVASTAALAPRQRFGVAHWSYGTVGWPLALLTLGGGIGVLASLLGVYYCATVVQVVLGGATAATFAGAVSVTAVTASFQLAVGVFAALLRRVAATAVAMAKERERLRTAEAVAAQLHADRRDRYASLAQSVTPLLGGLASGVLDPADEAVRRACAVEAARMRRLFAEDPTAPDPLVHELRACIELAERNGVAVQFAERGDRPPMPKEARRLLTEPAVAVLATAKSTARLTVVGLDGTVTVSVVADAPADAVPEVDSGGVTTSTVVTEDRIWVEATWRQA